MPLPDSCSLRQLLIKNVIPKVVSKLTDISMKLMTMELLTQDEIDIRMEEEVLQKVLEEVIIVNQERVKDLISKEKKKTSTKNCSSENSSSFMKEEMASIEQTFDQMSLGDSSQESFPQIKIKPKHEKSKDNKLKEK